MQQQTLDEPPRELASPLTFPLRPGRPLGVDLGDLRHVLRAPGAERHERLGEAVAEGGEAVVHPRRHLLVVGPLHQAIGFQLFELLDQHLVADIAHGAPELAVAGRAVMGEEVQDQWLPLARDDPQGRIEAAGEARQGLCAALDRR